jgi:predicted phage tail protein
MANHQGRLAKLRGHLSDVHDELHALAPEERDETSLARIDSIVAYAGAVLDATDPRLISTAAFSSIQSAACSISNSPRAALEEADACADSLVEALTMLPAPHGGEREQELRAAAADLAARLQSVRQDVDAEAERLRALRSDVDRWSSNAEQSIAKQQQALEASRRANAAAVQAAMDAFRGDLERAQAQAHDEVEERVAEIRRMEDECATLVQAITVAGTSEHYRRQARRQRVVAEVLRGLAVIATLGAVAVALLATAEADPTAESLLANLFAAVLLVGLAAYFARQSARHRAREEDAAKVQFELAAFSPFIEALTPERREEERVMMTRKLFGTAPPASANREEDGASVGFLSQRRRRKQSAASTSAQPEALLERTGGESPSNGSAAL